MRIHTLILVLVTAVSLTACGSTGKGSSKSELKQRAQTGDIDAQYQLGKRYSGSALPQGPQAVYWLCRAATQGHVPAQLELASLYEKKAQHGNVKASDSDHLSTRGNAYFWYTAAASQGSGSAFDSRDGLAAEMDAAEISEAKRRATRWQQSVCVEP